MLGVTSTEAATSADEHGGALLRVQDVSVAYAGVQALHAVSLDVPERAIVGVLGNNGAGKTTLLRAISGTLGAHRGAVTGGCRRAGGRPPARPRARGHRPRGRRAGARRAAGSSAA